MLSLREIVDEANFDWWKILTTREKEVYILFLQGDPYKQIAEKLFVSETTIKTHTNNIFQKLRPYLPNSDKPLHERPLGKGDVYSKLPMYVSFGFIEILKYLNNLQVSLEETIQAKKYKNIETLLKMTSEKIKYFNGTDEKIEFLGMFVRRLMDEVSSVRGKQCS